MPYKCRGLGSRWSWDWSRRCVSQVDSGVQGDVQVAITVRWA